ncbi:MAG: single-stranded-DNA-specific exonuclease RecJ [Clostridiales bacterium]|nr:single-stranded-DNA-specific exonuclease RecJ [Clostridiales bacterium]
MKYKKWNLPASVPSADALEEAGYPALLSAVLASHGITDSPAADDFLKIEGSLSLSPLLMKDMDRAVARIRAALDAGEHMAVFGDYDVDGITATAILVDYLRRCGAQVSHYIPRRIEDGYGLSADAMRTLRGQGITLVITVDCGITGVEEVDFAASLGMDVVVTDHHECKDELPRAIAVVDPHRPDCPYPFKHLAGCGVALKLVLALGGVDRAEELLTRYSPLAAVGTVADVMRMSGENRTIVARGLAHIADNDFIGLQALLQETGLDQKEITSVQIGYVLAPRINAAGRMGEADRAAELMLCKDPVLARELARELCQLNRQRQTVEQEIYAQAIAMIEEMPAEERNALVLADSGWHQGVVGIVASRLSEKYACPSFMIHLSGHTGKGSCRSWGGFNLFAALEECSDLLLGFGGHELAAGFTIEEDKIPAFRKRMNACVQRFLGGRPATSALDVDVVLRRPELITLWEVEQLRRLEPYGNGNNRPLFCLLGVTLDRVQGVGQNRHLKLRFSKGTVQLEGIFFSTTAQQCPCQPGGRVDVAFYLQINEFRGSRTVQLQVVDLRPSLQGSAREEESLLLLRRLEEGESLSSREALRILPSRQQCAAAWRLLRQEITPAGTERHYLPFLRQLSAAIPGTDPFLRACFCVELFCERGLLRREIRDEEIHLRLCSVDEKVDLEQSPYWTALQEYIRGK